MHDETRARYEAEFLESLSEILRIKDLAREVLRETLHVQAVFLVQRCSNLEESGFHGERLHDIPTGRLETKASFGICRSWL